MCPNFVEFYGAAADGNVMARNYFGASGEARVGAGLGANVLLSGRQDGFEVFTSSHRVTGDSVANVPRLARDGNIARRQK